jgi:hypothetical protein
MTRIMPGWLRSITSALNTRWDWPSWSIDEAAELLVRARRLRQVLSLTTGLNCGLVLLANFSAAMGLLTKVWWYTAAWQFLMAAWLLWVPNRLGYAYYARLRLAWLSFDHCLCASCGYIRDFSDSLRCPECGDQDSTNSAGKLPSSWRFWEFFFNLPTLNLPIGIVTLGVWLSTIARGFGIPTSIIGVFILALTTFGLILLVRGYYRFLKWPRDKDGGLVY